MVRGRVTYIGSLLNLAIKIVDVNGPVKVSNLYLHMDEI